MRIVKGDEMPCSFCCVSEKGTGGWLGEEVRGECSRENLMSFNLSLLS
jgi:hypothetical protein